MRYSLDVVRKHLRNQQGSGLSVSRYCTQHGLSTPAFYYWRRRHPPASVDGLDHKLAHINKLVAHPLFTRLEPVDIPAAYVLTTPGGSRIELAALGIDELARLVRLLESTDA